MYWVGPNFHHGKKIWMVMLTPKFGNTNISETSVNASSVHTLKFYIKAPALLGGLFQKTFLCYLTESSGPQFKRFDFSLVWILESKFFWSQNKSRITRRLTPAQQVQKRFEVKKEEDRKRREEAKREEEIKRKEAMNAKRRREQMKMDRNAASVSLMYLIYSR